MLGLFAWWFGCPRTQLTWVNEGCAAHVLTGSTVEVGAGASPALIVLGLMQTREELYERIGYHEFEQRLDALFAGRGPT